MSINWVMLSPTSRPPYTPLPHEQHLFTSSPRIALSLSTPSHYPGKQQQTPPFSLTSSSGLLYLTNQRLIYLPDNQPSRSSSSSSITSTSSSSLQSFAAPILSLHDSHVTAPWFGPNVWTALLQPTPGGGIPVPATGVVEVKCMFKDGGAFDFHAQYERLRERMQQAVEVGRFEGNTSGTGGAAQRTAAAAAAAAVHLDELPAYAERGDGPLVPPIVPPAQQQQQERQERVAQRGATSGVDGDARSTGADSAVGSHGTKAAEAGRAGGEQVHTPIEPPPGYEESQLAGLREEMERRRREGGDEDEDERNGDGSVPPR